MYYGYSVKSVEDFHRSMYCIADWLGHMPQPAGRSMEMLQQFYVEVLGNDCRPS